MAERISRRKIARLIAERIIAGESTKQLLSETAALLVESGRTREYELVVRDIEDALAVHGQVIADVTAMSVDAVSEADIRQLRPDAKKVYLREHIDTSVLGGVTIEFPGTRYDATIKRRLARLRSLEG